MASLWHGVVFLQVVLSLQLSFAVVPLVMFTADRKVVGREFVNSRALNVCIHPTTRTPFLRSPAHLRPAFSGPGHCPQCPPV